MITKKTEIFIFVIAVGVITACLSFLDSGKWDAYIIFKAGIIATVLDFMYKLFDHYAWRFPLIGAFSSTPNMRGTWRFEKPNVYRIEPSAKYVHLAGGFIVVWQSHSRIKLVILWDGDEPTELIMSSPLAVSGSMCAFTGFYIEKPGGTCHGFGGFIAFNKKCPSDFVLRYRTDNNVTGEIKAVNRIPKHISSCKEGGDAQSNAPSWWQKAKFSFGWM